VQCPRPRCCACPSAASIPGARARSGRQHAKPAGQRSRRGATRHEGFRCLNCSGCHAANGGGAMGPSLSDDIWIYRSSPANIYLSIAQGRAAGMPAFGAMLPDRTVWELVAISKVSAKSQATSSARRPRSIRNRPLSSKCLRNISRRRLPGSLRSRCQRMVARPGT